jgi:hypothetical protein
MVNKIVSEIFSENNINYNTGIYILPDNTISNTPKKSSINAIGIDTALFWIEKNKNIYIETEMYIIKDEKSALFNHKAYKLHVKTIENKKLITLLEKDMFSNRDDARIYAIKKVFNNDFNKKDYTNINSQDVINKVNAIFDRFNNLFK